MEDMKPEVTAVEVMTRGERGELGESTTADRLKRSWHQKHFKTVEVTDSTNGRVYQVLEAHPNAPSLKRFAREMAQSGDQDAKDWFAHKSGSLNLKRSDANIKAAYEAGVATKLEKRKKSAKGGKSGGKAAEAAVPTK